MRTNDPSLTSKDSSAIRDVLCDVAKRHPFATDDKALETFIDQWERGTLPKSCWTHGAHVGVAAYFAFEYPAEVLVRVMRLGIRHYNLASGGANTEDDGYHETLTRFWAGEVSDLVRSGAYGSRLEGVRAALARFGENSRHYRGFYDFDVLHDRKARRDWVAPDRLPEHQDLQEAAF